MRRGKRFIALILAVLLLATSDTHLYQVLATEQKGTTDSNAGAGTESAETDKNETDKKETVESTGSEQTPSANQDYVSDNPVNQPSVFTQPAESQGQPAPQSQETAEPGNANVPGKTTKAVDPINFDLSARASRNEISSGSDFDYTLMYNVPPLEGEAAYSGVNIEIAIPEYVEILTKPGETGRPSYQVIGVDVNSAVYNAGTRILTINMKANLTSGEGKTITIKMKAKNFETPSGSEIVLDPKLTGSGGGVSVIGSIAEDKRPIVRVNTDDGWGIEKSDGVVESNADKDNYYITYNITAKNQFVDGSQSSGDHLGRLDVEKFVLTDELPSSYPAGGGASEIVSVKMEGTELDKSEYSVEKNSSDGSVSRVTIDGHYSKVTEEEASKSTYLEAGKPKTTNYSITVKYPRAPYITPSNKELKEWTLENKAILTYKLLGLPDAAPSDIGINVLGEKETDVVSQDLTVKKMVQIGENIFPLDKHAAAAYGDTVKFTLYEDTDGTVATDKDGKVLAGNTTKVGDDGTVTFKNLRYGTYYLEETSGLGKFTKPSGLMKVSVSPAGVVTLDDVGNYQASVEENHVKVVNTTDQLGAVEFYKYGQDADDKINSQLSGAEFTLTNKATGEVYKAVSDNKGRVRFDALSEGDYVLKETSAGDADSQYETSSDEVEVTVTADTVTKPSNPAGAELAKKEQIADKGIFLNISPKGRLKIQKVDQDDHKVMLEGAEFKIYGPFNEEKTEIPKDAKAVQYQNKDYVMETSGEQGIAVSVPLKEGYYLLKEIKAPDGYAISKELTPVKVTARKTNTEAVVIENVYKLGLTFKKLGTVNSPGGQVAYTEELAGAKIEIYSDPEGKNLLETVETYLDGANGSTSKPKVYLAPGIYYYKEVVPPKGYTLPSPNDIKPIELRSGQTQFTVYDAAEYGQIKVFKTSTSNRTAALKGAEFEIYTDEGLTSRAKQADGKDAPVIKTGEDGYGISVILPVGEYYLKEVKAPDGYEINTEKIQVTVTKNTQIPITITNNPLQTIRIIKKDSQTDSPLKGIRFGLYSDVAASVKLAESTTDINGQCEFKELKPGTLYYIKEISTISGYVLSDRIYPVTTNQANELVSITEETVENDHVGRLIVRKTSDMDMEGNNTVPFAGVDFQLYKYDESKPNHIGDLVSTKATAGPDAEAVFDNLIPGEYILHEIEQEGYAPVEDIKITVTPGMNYNKEEPRVIHNTANKGKLLIEKVSSQNPEQHLEAVFELKDSGGKVVETLKTDKKTGIKLSGWLIPGDYTLTEKSVTGDGTYEYTVKADPIPVKIEAGKTTKLTDDSAITNEPKGKLTIQKKAKFQVSGKEPVQYDLTGAVFKLVKKSDAPQMQIDTAVYEKAETVDMSMPASAQGTTGFLDAGEYWLIEDKAPEDYKADPSDLTDTVTVGDKEYPCKEVTITAGTTDTSVTVNNITDKGKLRLYKRAFTAEGELLNGADFELYKETADGTVELPGGKKGSRVLGSASTDGAGDIMESGTNGKGSALTKDIEPGIYWLKEVDLSKIEGGPWYGLDEDGWTGPIEVKKGSEAQVTIINYKMSGTGTKTDDKGNTLQGATMGVFATMEEAMAMRDVIESRMLYKHEAGSYPNWAAYKSDLEKDAFLSENNIIQTAVSGKNGTFEFKGLVPGGTYYIMELLPPEPKYGFALDNNQSIEIKQVTVKEDGTGFTKAVVFQDYLLGSAQVTKWTTIGGKDYWVEGVSFSVYRAKPSNVKTEYQKDGAYYEKRDEKEIASGTTDKDGQYTTILLPEGTYIIEETSVEGAGGIVSDTSDQAGRYRILTIKRRDKNTEYTAREHGKGFYNEASYGKFLLQKVDPSGNPTKGAKATFELQKLENGEYKTYKTFDVPMDGTIYESEFLPAGETYRIVETKADGYTIKYGVNGAIPITIVGGQFTGSLTGDDVPSNNVKEDQPLVLTNEKQGSIEIQKKGIFSGDGQEELIEYLKGITFTLYKADPDHPNEFTDWVTKHKVSAKTTDSGGKCTWDKLDAGKYWIQETGLGSLGSKYVLDDTPIPVTVEVGAKTTLTGNKSIINETTYGRLKIKKVDANDPETGLSAAFNIFTDKECKTPAKYYNGTTASFTTGSDGTGSSKYLPAGHYWLKEKSAPAGYLDNTETVYGGEQGFKVESNKVTDLTKEPITNKKEFKIKVIKTVKKEGDLGTGRALKGVEFGLYADKGNASAENYKDLALVKKTTGEDGTVVFDGLSADETGSRTYYIREISVPAGYRLNEEIREVEVNYNTQKNTPVIETAFENDALGKIKIEKIGSWKQIDDTSKQTLPLPGVTFEVRDVDGNVVDTITTAKDGTAISKGLPAGTYTVAEKEAAPGYAKVDTVYIVEVKDNYTNTELTEKGSQGAVVNVPDKGRFTLRKYDGNKEVSDKTKLTALTGATFELRKWSGSEWVYNNPDEKTFTVEAPEGSKQPEFTSGLLEPGRYQITEIKAPTYVYDGKEYTFALDSTPIEFEVTAGETILQEAFNSLQGTIVLSKTGDQNNGSVPINGAAFKMYTDAACTKEVENSLQYSNAKGLSTWNNVNPGTYWIKEVITPESALALGGAGYTINTEPVQVTVEAGKILSEVIAGSDSITVDAGTIVDPSNTGRFLIRKTDKDGKPISGNALTGAQFAIYAEEAGEEDGYSRKPADTVTVTDGNGTLSSKLLPAAKNGTKYKIVEIKAPDGYTLDGSIEGYETVQYVTLFPYQNPDISTPANIVTFKNKKLDDVAGFAETIKKQVKEETEGDESYRMRTDAKESLLENSYTVDYKLSDYADGKSEIGADSFIVTDNQMELYYLEKVNDSTEQYVKMDSNDKDYRVNHIQLFTTWNELDVEAKVSAEIQVQYSNDQKAAGTWTTYTTVDDLTGTQKVVFPDDVNVIGVRVKYHNVKAGFNSEGMVLNVTYANRAEWSSAEIHEPRKVTNQAELAWEDSRLDASGGDAHRQKGNIKTEIMESYFPAYMRNIPQVSIVNEVASGNKTYYSGDAISYKVTVENHKVDSQPDTPFKQPLVSVKLPATTTLNEMKGFTIYRQKKNEDGTLNGEPIPITKYTMLSSPAQSVITDKGDGNHETSGKEDTMQYIFEFSELQLDVNEQLLIEFSGYVGYNREDNVTHLVCPAYLSSTMLIPKSAENKLGLSFQPYDKQQPLVPNEEVKKELENAGEESNVEYLNNTDSVPVTDAESVKLVKAVGVETESGIVYKNPGEAAQVNPGEKLHYKLTLYNFSKDNVTTARIIDVLPFKGDTYIKPAGGRYVSRLTTIPGDNQHERVTFDSINASGASIYYYNDTVSYDGSGEMINGWSSRSLNEIEQDGRLNMLYYKKGTWNDKWSQSYTDKHNVTAVGADITFPGEGLKPGEDYTIELVINTPGYTAEQIDDYADALMANSAVAAVIRDVEGQDTIEQNDRVEPDRVIGKLNLPVGAIGDYAWYDANSNGIQDADEKPAAGVTVHLEKTKYYKVNDELRSFTTKENTVTRKNGYYEFTGLACNNMKDGKTDDPDNPDNYVGGAYYEYLVKFDIPEGYSATDKGKGDDRAADSNINSYGETDKIRLMIKKNEDGTLSADRDMTIDAGFVRPMALGNRVWLDTNCNGIQDGGEPGVADVMVNLYRVDNADSSVAEGQKKEKQTTTNADGYYWFEGLVEGYYVIEFDISTKKKTDGYTYRYDFTGTDADGTGLSGFDSDARNAVDEDGRIKRTQVITLTTEALKDYVYNDPAKPLSTQTINTDPRWDAGLVYYSAIGGFCYDDQNYNDLQDLKIPLLGTKVYLYEVNNGVRGDQPIRTTTVDEKGHYFFDHLIIDNPDGKQSYSVYFDYPDGYKGVLANKDPDSPDDYEQGTTDPAKDSAIDSDVNEYVVDSGMNQGYIKEIVLGRDMVTKTWDAGARKYSALGDYVWTDKNKNGIQDDDEHGVPDVKVVLQSKEADTEAGLETAQWKTLETAVTDESGKYLFENLKSTKHLNLRYRVVFALDGTTQMTVTNAGKDVEKDSDAITTYTPDIIAGPEGEETGGFITRAIELGYGVTDLSWDAGIIRELSELGDYVWYDDNYDGVQQDTEKGVPDVPVVIEFNVSGRPGLESGWVAVGTTVTDATGHYLFTDLEPGYYRVRYQLPEGYRQTLYNRGGNSALDSDASRRGDDNWYYSRSFYLEGGISDLTWDAGIYKPQTRTVRRTTTRTVTRTRNSSRQRASRTGDMMPVEMWLGIAGIAAVCGVYVYRRKRKNSKGIKQAGNE